MSQEQINISHMQCWLFRLAQRKWRKTPEETNELFRKFDLFRYITDCYEVLQLSSYEYALSDLERVLAKEGVVVCEQSKTVLCQIMRCVVKNSVS